MLALCLFEQLQPVEGEVSTDTHELHGMGNFRRSKRGREKLFWILLLLVFIKVKDFCQVPELSCL